MAGEGGGAGETADRAPSKAHERRPGTHSPHTVATYPLQTRVGRRRCSRGCCKFSGSSGTSERGSSSLICGRRTLPGPQTFIIKPPRSSGRLSPKSHKGDARYVLASSAQDKGDARPATKALGIRRFKRTPTKWDEASVSRSSIVCGSSMTSRTRRGCGVGRTVLEEADSALGRVRATLRSPALVRANPAHTNLG